MVNPLETGGFLYFFTTTTPLYIALSVRDYVLTSIVLVKMGASVLMCMSSVKKL